MKSLTARIVALLAVFCLGSALAAPASGPSGGPAPEASATSASAVFEVRRYEVRGYSLPPSDALAALLANYTGPSISLARLVEAATVVQREYASQGRTNVSISIAPHTITNGVVILHAFRGGGSPMVLVSGKAYPTTPLVAAAGQTNAVAATTTNAPPPVKHLDIKAYEVTGDNLLTLEALGAVLGKNTGTNLTITNILAAASDLQAEYVKRGYATVRVTLPPQQVTNGIVKIRVFEGRLTEIDVTHNRYFSSNNVMRALPSLRTNTLLVRPVFQAELDRANANQDRQIWPEIEPGAEEGTSRLNLVVKDRLPLHAKLEFGNQNSPGTPDLRLSSSLAYQNLWQLEHAVGLQYSFSPEAYKDGSWNFYDRPLVANYGAFYRLPLGDFGAIGEQVGKDPGKFGYDEASRKFNLPPTSGRPELNFFASRSTIDTGLSTLAANNVESSDSVIIDRQDVQRDLTTTADLGTRISLPLPASDKFQSGFSGGFDYKSFEMVSAKTNIYYIRQVVTNTLSGSTTPVVTTNLSIQNSPVPTTTRTLEYVPLSFRYDASWRDWLGTTRLGLGVGMNLWHSGTAADVQNISSSTNSSGHWVTLNPSLSRDFALHKNWILSVRADGQWASEPLISNEQFGLGGLNSVRGYHEGEVFGDNGWHVSVEQSTPPYVVGGVSGKNALVVRGMIYTDYGEAYLLDPQGRDARVPLWGGGFGTVASIGARWEARMLFSWPLLNAGTTPAMAPRFDFSLSAQF